MLNGPTKTDAVTPKTTEGTIVMSQLTQNNALRALALIVAAALVYAGSDVPDQLWIVVGVLAGATVKRPGDIAPDELGERLSADARVPGQ